MTATARPSIRQAHKDMTRARIAAAARQCFYAKGVAETSFEEIAAKAGVTRATIYLHFANRGAILAAILGENLEEACGIYAKLGARRAPDLASVRTWLEGYVNALVKHRRALALFYVTAGDSDVRALIDAYQDRVVEILGARFPAFDINVGPDRVRRRTAALLAIARVDGFASAAAQVAPHIDVEAGLDLMSEDLAGLLASS